MADRKTYTRICEGCGKVMHNVGKCRHRCDECGKKRHRELSAERYRKNFSATAKKASNPKNVKERDAEFRAENQRFIESAGSSGKGRLKEYLAAQKAKGDGSCTL